MMEMFKFGGVEQWVLGIFLLIIIYGITCGSSLISRVAQCAIIIFVINESKSIYAKRGLIEASFFVIVVICASFAPIVLPILFKFCLAVLKLMFKILKWIWEFMIDRIDTWNYNRKVRKAFL